MSVPPHDPLLNARLTGYTRKGFSVRYQACRPKPPAALADVLLGLAGTRRPDLVVDLGSGTGISTRIWAAHAGRVIGVEPLDEMREITEAGERFPNVEFRSGVAQHTGLPAASADIVTCAQSLHHTEPRGTLAEVGRILKPGGVFAAYDYDVPPLVHWQVELVFAEFMNRVDELRARRGIRSEQQRWGKDEHAERMRESGTFRYLDELVLHSTEPCTAERWVDFACSIGIVLPLLDLGLSDDELGLIPLREISARILGDTRLPWHVSYRVRVGVK